MNNSKFTMMSWLKVTPMEKLAKKKESSILELELVKLLKQQQQLGNKLSKIENSLSTY